MQFTKFFFLFLDSRLSQIDRYADESKEIQEQQLLSLIDSAYDTEWGRRYKYDKLVSYEQFASIVPISGYDDLKPYIDRMMLGESDILWKGRPKWFAKSSGTTNDKSKFIPVSQSALDDCHYKGAKDAIALYSRMNPNSKLFSGKSMILGGSHKLLESSTGISVGDLSAILLQNSPDYFSLLRVPDKKIALMDEWESKIKAIVDSTYNQDVVSLAGVPSWMLVLLKAIVEKSGKSNITEVWPNLELFFHGGISFLPYRPLYEQIIPKKEVYYVETYNASEGFFAIQNDLSDSSMLLMIDLGIFYEFIPMDQFDQPNRSIIPLSEVQIGRNYAMVITTNSGLWRYIIGDTVRFTSLKPHKLLITGRTKHFMNAFGEEVMVDNADRAIVLACQSTGVKVLDYTAAPIYMSEGSGGAHQWIVEFVTPPEDITQFVVELDSALKSLNSDYEAKRYKDLTLGLPQVTVAKNGLFAQWMTNRGKVGGQNKVPRLSNTREFVDQLVLLNDQL
ncbi:MAG: GH3 auxin-responsive promoter family protein [Bacteroidales bacterium]